jgi:hypothetical protein
MRIQTAIVILIAAQGLTGCDGAGTPSPTAPSAQPQQTLQQSHSGGDTYYMANLALFGMVYEMTPTGRVPLAGVHLWSSEQAGAETDSNGMYRVKPVWVCPCTFAPAVASSTSTIQWSKAGYANPDWVPPTVFPWLDEAGFGWRDVTINGDTRFDIELVRR